MEALPNASGTNLRQGFNEGQIVQVAMSLCRTSRAGRTTSVESARGRIPRGLVVFGLLLALVITRQSHLLDFLDRLLKVGQWRRAGTSRLHESHRLDITQA